MFIFLCCNYFTFISFVTSFFVSLVTIEKVADDCCLYAELCKNCLCREEKVFTQFDKWVYQHWSGISNGVSIVLVHFLLIFGKLKCHSGEI